MQLTDLPGIASAGAWNIVTPPRCKRYIILADNGDAGQKWAKNLAHHLLEQFPDSAVQIATPIKPTDAKEGYDWNDALMGDTGAGILAMAINAAPNADAAQVQRKKLLAELAALDRLDYEAPKRKEAARELGLRRSVLDEEVAKRAKKKTPPTVKPVDIKKLAKSAKDIIESDDVLDIFSSILVRCLRVSAGMPNCFISPHQSAADGGDAYGDQGTIGCRQISAAAAGPGILSARTRHQFHRAVGKGALGISKKTSPTKFCRSVGHERQATRFSGYLLRGANAGGQSSVTWCR